MRMDCCLQILATGGMSFPKLGTDGTGHRIADNLGHEMRPSYPALVPLRSSHPAGEQLAGEAASPLVWYEGRGLILISIQELNMIPQWKREALWEVKGVVWVNGTSIPDDPRSSCIG